MCCVCRSVQQIRSNRSGARIVLLERCWQLQVDLYTLVTCPYFLCVAGVAVFVDQSLVLHVVVTLLHIWCSRWLLPVSSFGAAGGCQLFSHLLRQVVVTFNVLVQHVIIICFHFIAVG